jgi:hypothetical protein
MPGGGLQEIEVLLVRGHGGEDAGEEGDRHDQDGDEDAAEDHPAPQGAPHPSAEPRYVALGPRSHEHGLACELQRRDARRVCRRLSRAG